MANAPLKDAVTPPRDLALEAARVGYELVAAGLPAVLALSDVEGHAALVSRLLAHASSDANDCGTCSRGRERWGRVERRVESLAPPTALFLTTPLVRRSWRAAAARKTAARLRRNRPASACWDGAASCACADVQATDRSGLWIAGAGMGPRRRSPPRSWSARRQRHAWRSRSPRRVVPRTSSEVGRRIRAQLRVS
ncbi:MAG: hypothetical protein U0610_04320 [bacterium]